MDVDEVTALALTGYGHFTTMLVESGAVRGLALHYARLSRDCRAVFGTDLDLDRVRAGLRRALDGRGGPVVARVTVFDPALSLVHPSDARDPQVMVTLRPAPMLPPAPIRVRPVRYRRQAAAIKSAALFEPLHLRRAAQLAGFDDALFVDALFVEAGGAAAQAADTDEVSEGPTWNVGFLDGERLVVPDADQLPGVTMALLAGAYGRCRAEPVPLSRLGDFEAVFATNATGGVRPLTAVGTAEFPADHPAFAQLRAAYESTPPEKLF